MVPDSPTTTTRLFAKTMLLRKLVVPELTVSKLRRDELPDFPMA
jgi:hypothetical protein